MDRTEKRNSVLLYFNLRKRKFAIVGDDGVHTALGQKYWEQLGRDLRENLHATHLERAVALTVKQLGEALRAFFPEPLGG